MTIKNPIKRPANVKKALPSIRNMLVYILFGLIAGWMLCRFHVEVNGGEFPNMGLLSMAISMGESFGLWGAGGSATIGGFILREIYRKRGDK